MARCLSKSKWVLLTAYKGFQDNLEVSQGFKRCPKVVLERCLHRHQTYEGVCAYGF